MLGTEKRRHRRFDLSLPVAVRMETASEIKTATKDISARGIYFTMDEGYQLGSQLECVVTLPPELCQGNMIQVRCRGKIVRVEPPDAQKKVGIAASIEDYEFVKTN